MDVTKNPPNSAHSQKVWISRAHCARLHHSVVVMRRLRSNCCCCCWILRATLWKLRCYFVACRGDGASLGFFLCLQGKSRNVTTYEIVSVLDKSHRSDIRGNCGCDSHCKPNCPAPSPVFPITVWHRCPLSSSKNDDACEEFDACLCAFSIARVGSGSDTYVKSIRIGSRIQPDDKTNLPLPTPMKRTNKNLL